MTDSVGSDSSEITEYGSDIGDHVDHESEDDDWNPWFLDGDRDETIEYIEFSDEDASSISEGYPNRELQCKELKELHKEGDYWQIQKLIKFLKVGDQTTTAIALACLTDLDYRIEANQAAFLDSGGLEILINLLEAKDFRCQLGAIVIISKLCVGPQIQRSIVEFGAVIPLVKLLSSNIRDLQKYAAITIMHIAKQKTCRTIVRKKGGVAMLVDLADNPDIGLKPDKIAPDTLEKVELTKVCIHSLAALAKSKVIREMLYTCGIVKLFPNLLKSSFREVVVSTLKIMMMCSCLPQVVKSIESSGQLQLLSKHLYQEDPDKDELICKIVYRCSESEISRKQMAKLKLVKHFCSMIKKYDNQTRPKLLKYCVGTIWRSLDNEDNLVIVDDANLVPVLVQLLSQKNAWVRANIAGCLAELTRYNHNQLKLLKVQGLDPLVTQANIEWNTELLENLVRAIGNCAESPECAPELNRLDGLRVVWSLLDGNTEKLQAFAGRALVPIIKNGMDIGEKVRCLEGGIELLMSKLESNNKLVVAASCAALAEVMMDEENLDILSELHIVEKLTKLTSTDEDVLRESLSRAIASCSMSQKNGELFGRLGAIKAIVGYLTSTSLEVVVAAVYALWKLSIEPINCITLHRSDVVPFLLECVGSDDYKLQEAAAGCLTNLRQLTLEADQRKHLRGRLIADVNKPLHFKKQFENLLEATTVQELYKISNAPQCTNN